MTDLVETLEEDDDSWLVAYLAAWAAAGTDATAVLKAVLRAVPGTVELDHRQERRVRSIAGAGVGDDPLRDRLDRGEVDQAAVILELLHVLNVFEAAAQTG